jgi:tetratricopeptide (TPR) repeat protein
MSGPEVDGTLLIGANELFEVWGTKELSPYSQFRNAVPLEILSGTVLVFRGRFELPLAFAVAEINQARALSERGHIVEAVNAARKAVAAAPDLFTAHAELARSLKGANQIEEARKEYQSAMFLIGKIRSEYTQRAVVQLETEFQNLPEP